MRLTNLFLPLCLITVCAAPVRAERLRMEVGGPNFKPYPVATPELVMRGGQPGLTAAVGREMTELLQTGVELARSLELVPPKTYLDADKEPVAQPNFKNWAQVGASGLIRGSLEVEGRRVAMDLRFFDINQSREVLRNTCTQTPDNARLCVHQFLDNVIEYLTGDQGIFSSRLAYVRRVGRLKHIFAADIDGGNVQRLTDNKVLNLLPAWDPAGAYLLFTSYLTGNPDLYRMRLADRSLSPLSKAVGLNIGGAVSPDGKQVALTLSKDGNTEIYVMNSDATHLRRLTDSFGQDVSPTWSPDSKRLAFVSSRSGNPHIYVMNADGHAARRLTFQGNYNQEPDWSPRADGRIAFTARDETFKYDVFLVHPDTGAITRLTQDDGHNESPSHSPDGHHLVFTSSRGPTHKKELWIMDVDGNSQRRVNVEPGDYETPAWGPRLGYR
jgi:TolB protein